MPVKSGTIRAAALMAAAALSAAGQVENGASISGKVTGPAGTPLPGITLMLTAAAIAPGAVNLGVFGAVSAADGAFAITPLSAGEYNLCASDDAGRFLNPCAWSGPVRVTVAAGQSVMGAEVRMEEAAEVVIELRDPERRLAATGKQPSAHSLMVGIPAPYLFVPATGGGDTATGRTYKAYVPYDRDIEVSVVSPTLALTDEAGQALRTGGDALRLRVPTGQRQRTVVINVVGSAS